MMNALHITAAAVSLTLAAGLAIGQNDVRNSKDAAQRDRQVAATGATLFEKGSVLIGKDVANPNNEVIAKVEDFIIQRGSGRIEHVLLKSGAVLGVGGKTIAVPYTRVRFDEVKERFEMDMTDEQIDRAVSFVPENWAELQSTTWAETLDKWWYGEDEVSNDDMAVQAVKTGTPETIKGEIVSVERTGGVQGERVIVAVQSSEGRVESLLFGPSWYVMGHEAAPMRGDSIEAETVRLPAGEEGRRLVLTAKIDGDTMMLRDSQGQARWRIAPDVNEKNGGNAAKRPEGRTAGRLMLMSDLIGADAMTTDDTGGEVQDVVVERGSGQIALIGFDPNENLLGIADEIKAVPWGVVRVAPDQKVYIDASSAMLKACGELPDDVSIYSTAAQLEPVYTTFALKPVKFTARDRDEARMPIDTAWGKDGFYSKTFRDAPDATITGRVTNVRTTSLRDGTPEARVVSVATQDGERSIILGPEWYLKRQTVKIKDGDEVTIQGKRAKIGEREYICAHSITAEGRALTLWESDSPVWLDGR